MLDSLLIKPLMNYVYPKAVRASGIYIYDENGKEYLDGSSGAVTASIGHAVPEIIKSAYEQSQKLSFVYRSQFTTDPAEALAKRLSALVNAEQDYWSFFVNSGSEATETAMKIAIQYWQEQGKHKKMKILSRRISYHGITLGALSMSGHLGRRERFVELLEDYPTVAPPYCYRCPFQSSVPKCGIACADDLETAIKRIGAEHIAAFIAEPIVGAAGGVIVPPDGYYQKIKQICEQNDILFIADEVMTGIGRTGKMFAIDYWDVKPDIMTLGKGMSAGYSPIAATMASEAVISPILTGSKVVMSGHTFSANPQSTAVGLAVIDYIEKNDLVNASFNKGKYLMEKLKGLANSHSIIGDIRGKGLMIGIEFVENQQNKKSYPSSLNLTNKIVNIAQNNGLLLYPSSAGTDGKGGDAVIIAPPLTIKKKQIRKLVELLDKTLLDIKNS
ncbi:aspartate aminotransferase family protein [Halalkalibacter krulwichiae]|uniref:Taurine--pyruvate aminotransferase n=1 Tax=Halalkalibacter krulwichiae TaxID=199441 RepID=A0A1X9MAX7_9BACI|nr:aspartate aminotransferase family protein [Halalkalibacter krulwichiae]ARK30567.1 Taurine--pyruvate aminotransferase [Halalkalibacter krulwichiae]